jgi:cell division protein FtsL
VGDLATLLPAGGVAVAFVVLIGYLIHGNRLDRRDYRQAIKDADREVEEERARNRGLQQQLDDERAQRRLAEDIAGRATAGLDRANEEIASLKLRVRNLEEQLVRGTGAPP